MYVYVRHKRKHNNIWFNNSITMDCTVLIEQKIMQHNVTICTRYSDIYWMPKETTHFYIWIVYPFFSKTSQYELWIPTHSSDIAVTFANTEYTFVTLSRIWHVIANHKVTNANAILIHVLGDQHFKYRVHVYMSIPCTNVG